MLIVPCFDLDVIAAETDTVEVLCGGDSDSANSETCNKRTDDAKFKFLSQNLE